MLGMDQIWRAACALEDRRGCTHAGSAAGANAAVEPGAAGAAPALPSTAQQTASGLSVVSGEEEAQEVLDWKGEPMKINPGDKLPFKFL